MSMVNDDPPARTSRQRSVFFETVEMYEKQLAESSLELARLTTETDAQQKLVIEQEGTISELRAYQTELLASTSWRVTRPMRKALDMLRRATRS